MTIPSLMVLPSIAPEQGHHSHSPIRMICWQNRLIRWPSKLGSDLTVPCDVSVEGGIDTALDTMAKSWNQIDFIVHAVAFADKNELKALISILRAKFSQTMMVSCYSLTELARAALQMMPKGGSLHDIELSWG